MPHLPGHIKPFTDFLTRGMRNTNQNINNINTPVGQTNYLNTPNQFNNPFTSPYQPPTGYGFTQPGFGAGRAGTGAGTGGGYMGYEGGMHHSGGGGWGEPGGSTGPGGQYTPGTGQDLTDPTKQQEGEGQISDFSFNPEDMNLIYSMLPQQLQQQIQEQGGFYGVDNPGSLIYQLMQDFFAEGEWDMSGLQDWIENYTSGYVDDPTVGPGYGEASEFDEPDITDIPGTTQPTEELPPGWTWQFINGNWEPVEVGAGEGQQGEQDFTGETGIGTDFGIDIPSYLQEEEEEIPIGGMYYNKPYLQDTYGEGWEWVFNEDTGEYEQQYTPPESTDIDLGSLNIDFDLGLGGLTDDIAQMLHESEYSPVTAAEFTGGGGTAGQAARRLYYPGTSGGFAGVGSGIGGGQAPNIKSLLEGLMG